jgi:hypothetical protein
MDDLAATIMADQLKPAEDAMDQQLSPVELEAMLERAANKGAKQALESIGLHGEGAQQDVNELRSFISFYRKIRDTAVTTITRSIIMGIIGLLALGLYIKTGKLP